MKKIRIICLVICLAAVMSACRNKTDEKDNTVPEGNISQTLTPAPTQEEALVTSEASSGEKEAKTIGDYFPFRESRQYIYEGEGNEYASFWTYSDYEDKDNGLIQLRTDNGGTQTVQVMEVNENSLSVIVLREECYYRDNLLKYDSMDTPEILLKAPLEKGTEWTLSDGRKRSISDVDKDVSTPYGEYKAIEVTTEGQGGTSRDYYAQGIGLIKRVYTNGDMEVTSTLKIIKDTALVQDITLYYPDADDKILEEAETLSFYTNDITRLKMQELLRKKHDGNQGLISVETKLNALYRGADGIVYSDFSKELISEMNAGSGQEARILQSIADTLGKYYDSKEICLTVDQKPYESGHILLKKGETLKVSW